MLTLHHTPRRISDWGFRISDLEGYEIGWIKFDLLEQIRRMRKRSLDYAKSEVRNPTFSFIPSRTPPV